MDNYFYNYFDWSCCFNSFCLEKCRKSLHIRDKHFFNWRCSVFLASFLDLEALRKGKLDVVEPIWSLEIVSSALLAFFLLGEKLSLFQFIFVILLIVSLTLVSLKRLNFEKKILIEKGVYIAIIAAIAMGIANFFIGVGSRNIDPITMKWGMDVFLTVGSMIFILKNKEYKNLSKKLKQNKKTLFS